MKYLLFITLTLFSVKGYSQDKDPLRLFDSTRKTSPEFDSVYKDVKGAIEGLSAGLKTTADHVWGVLIKQQIIESIEGLVWVLLAIFFVYKFVQEACLEELRVLAVVWGILAAIFSIAALCSFSDIITGFFNPEYGALQKIMSHL